MSARKGEPRPGNTAIYTCVCGTQFRALRQKEPSEPRYCSDPCKWHAKYERRKGRQAEQAASA